MITRCGRYALAGEKFAARRAARSRPRPDQICEVFADWQHRRAERRGQDPARPEYGTITMVFVRDGAPCRSAPARLVALDLQTTDARPQQPKPTSRSPIPRSDRPALNKRGRSSNTPAGALPPSAFAEPPGIDELQPALCRQFLFSLATGKAGYFNSRRRQHGPGLASCCPARLPGVFFRRDER